MNNKRYCYECENLDNAYRDGSSCYVPGQTNYEKNGKLLVRHPYLLNKHNNCKYWRKRRPWYFHILDLFKGWSGVLPILEYPKGTKKDEIK